MSKANVFRILRNILYSGYIQMEKKGNHKKKKQGGTVRSIPLRQGKHEGIISYSTWEAIQEKLDGRKTYKPPVSDIQQSFPLRRFLHDGENNLAVA